MAKNRIVFSDDFILKNQKIGIGTSDPKESLDVVGNATISQNLYVGNSIGIGTTSPKSDFDVNGTLSVSGVSTFSNDVNILSSINGNPIGKFNDGGNVELYNNGSKKFETTGIGVSVYNGSSDTATIEGPGNLIIDPMPVGVGTTSGVVRIRGDLYVDGTETIINSTTIELADFIVGIASTATTDMLADGAGIKIGPDNTFLYEYNGGTNPSLKSSENLNVESGKVYQIDQTEVLSSTTLGSGVTQSSLTGVGILTALSVSGDVSVTDKIVHTGDTDTAIRFPSDNTFTIETNGQERLRVTGIATQSVGIGTTDPTALLDIAGSIRIRGVFYDELNHPGGANQVLSATGTGVTWTGFSDISVGDASTLDNLDSTQFLRSDENDTKSGITTFQALVDIDANLDIRDTLTVGQGVTVTGISTFNSNVDIDANVDIRDTLTVGQGVTITGISTFNSNVDVDANVDIRDTLTVGQGVTVTGISTFNDNVDINANLDIRDNLTVGGGLTVTGVSTFASNLDIDASVDIQNTLTVGQGVTITGISTFNSNVDVKDTLIVGQGVTITGVSTFNDNVNISNTLIVGQGVTVTGVSTFNDNVDVKDTLIVGQGVTITGISTFNNNVDVKDTLIVGQGVTVTGISTFNNNVNISNTLIVGQGVTITGVSTFNDNVDVKDTLIVGQGVTITGVSTFNDNVLFADGTESNPSISFKLDQNTGIFRASEDEIAFATNATERARIISDGKVGIGTTIPTQLLDVNGDLRLRGALYDSGINTTGTSLQSLVSTGVGVSWKDSNTIASGQDIFTPASGTPYYITATNNTSGIATAAFNDSTIVIKDSNIGIGTNSPTQLLDVNGDLRLRGGLYVGTAATSGKVNQTLISTGAGVSWVTMATAAAGQEIFEAESSTPYYIVGTGITPSSSGVGTAGFAVDTIVLKDSNIGIGTDNPQSKLDVIGDIKISGVSTLGTVQISSGIITATSGVVTYYGDGSNLTGVSAESVDSYQFNTGITSSFSAVLTGIGGSIITFPSTAGKQYIVYSIHAANVAAGNTEVNVTGAFDFNGGERSYFAYSVPIPTGTGIDLLIQPQILNPSDQIAMRGLDYDRNGADSVVEVHVSYQEKTSTEYFGVGFGTVGIGFTDPIGIYTSSTYPSVIQSIRLTNRTDTGAYPISLSIANGVSTIRIVDNLIIPKYGSVEIIDSSPKRLNLNDILNVQVDQTSTIDVQVSGKQIV